MPKFRLMERGVGQVPKAVEEGGEGRKHQNREAKAAAAVEEGGEGSNTGEGFNTVGTLSHLSNIPKTQLILHQSL